MTKATKNPLAHLAVKDMKLRVDAGMATIADAIAALEARHVRYVAAGKKLDRTEKAIAHFRALAEPAPVAEPVAEAPVAKRYEPAGDASWKQLTEAVLAAAPNATTAQVAAFMSKLVRANG